MFHLTRVSNSGLQLWSDSLSHLGSHVEMGLHYSHGYSEGVWLAYAHWVFNSIFARFLLLGIKIFLTRAVL
jgi:hypothetical protein